MPWSRVSALLAAIATSAAVHAAPVPPPFEPVAVVNAEGAVIVTVWGRSYRFERHPLPVSIRSQGVELWAAPPALEVALADVATPIAWEPISVEETRPDRVKLLASGRAGQLRLRARTRVEYDGMIQVEMELHASAPLRVTRYAYALQLPAAVARSFNHHVPYDYETLNVDKRNMLDAAGVFPAALRRLDFVPSLFVGNRQVGVEWWSESDAEWTGSEPPLRLERSGDRAHLRVEPIAAPLPLARGQVWTDRFALFPAPMRPPPDRWRDLRFTSAWKQPLPPEQSHLRRVWIAFPNAFEARWHGLPQSRRNAAQEQLRARLRASQTRYIPYGLLTATPALHEFVMSKASEWSANSKLNTGAPAPMRRFFAERGDDYEPGQPYAYAPCMGRRDYLDWMLERFVSAFREEDLDGLYFDHATISRMCLNSPLLEGRTGKEVWEYFNVRAFYKRLYETMKADDPDSLLVLHTHGAPRALAAWGDFTFIGEAWNVLFRDGKRWKDVARNPSLYDADYFRLPQGYLEAQLLPRMGGVTAVLPEVKFAIDPERPERARAFQRAMFARILPYDVPYWHANSERIELRSVTGAFDRFGSLQGARVFPWWEGRGAVSANEAIVVTSYAKDGRALLVVANWGEQPVDARLALEREALGLGRSLRVRDAEGRGAAPRLVEDSVRVTVPARDLRLLLVEAKR